MERAPTPSPKREREHCKVKRVYPRPPLRVHSAGTKGLAAEGVGIPERRALIVSGRFTRGGRLASSECLCGRDPRRLRRRCTAGCGRDRLRCRVRFVPRSSQCGRRRHPEITEGSTESPARPVSVIETVADDDSVAVDHDERVRLERERKGLDPGSLLPEPLFSPEAALLLTWVPPAVPPGLPAVEAERLGAHAAALGIGLDRLRAAAADHRQMRSVPIRSQSVESPCFRRTSPCPLPSRALCLQGHRTPAGRGHHDSGHTSGVRARLVSSPPGAQ